MSKEQKKLKTSSRNAAYTHVKTYKTIRCFTLPNKLTVLFMHVPGTGVVTTNITYAVGARDEKAGETGLAHMLEHMLFKPTVNDLARKTESASMVFEKETGCVLNANTWKDRTTYYFSYPKQYFTQALKIEAERMRAVVLSDTEFQPERNNVLSEFDMYFGDAQFALEVEMVASAFREHPYGHETIGSREDIEGYTVGMLKDFYDRFYHPRNATLSIIGDIDEETALREVVATLGRIPDSGEIVRNVPVREPKQQGLRCVSVERDSTTNIVAFGVRHQGFPSKQWRQTQVLAIMLSDGPESILHKRLIDTGLATAVDMHIEPTSESNTAILFVTITKKATHAEIEKIVFEEIGALKVQTTSRLLRSVKQKILTGEVFGRDSSLSVAAELTEYVSAQCWEAYFDTEKMLSFITGSDIIKTAQELFTKQQMTIGHFIGTSST